MKLNDYIASSIFTYPSLYYKSNYEDSRRAVLNQMFLVIGNGIDFKPQKNGKGFFSERTYRGCKRKQKLKKSDVQRITNGEKLAVIFTGTIDEKLAQFGIVHRKHDVEKRTVFYQDLLDSGEKHLICNDKVREPIDTNKHKTFVEIYPEDDKNYKWHPYPFSLKYSSLHDDKTGQLIAPDRIAEDWRLGIVEIFERAKAWFEDDLSFMLDPYFNWAGHWQKNNTDHFVKAWNEQPDKLRFCDAYEIPRKAYTDPKEMAVDIVAHNRSRQIADCDMVIKMYQ